MLNPYVELRLITFNSCSKDDNIDFEVEATPQYPLKTLIESGHMNVTYEKVDDLVYELGYRFKTFKNGKITALGIRVPDNGIYRVTLWNIDAEEILITRHFQKYINHLIFS